MEKEKKKMITYSHKLEGSHWELRIIMRGYKSCLKFCAAMMRRKLPMERVKNMWNEKGTKLKI